VITTAHRRTAWQVQSLLLSYPDDALLGHRPVLRAAVAALPPVLGTPLERFLGHLDATPATELAASYVATFDQQKRCAPYLTYFACGDTRKRGVALLRFTHAYRAAGMRLAAAELPDHLSVVLEFAALGDPDVGGRLLAEHRAGLELIRLALHEGGSPWAGVLDSVCATLAPMREHDRDTLLRLAAQGPPEEQVGLAPFAPPEYLPDPTVRPQQGARR
jgi:nitrate reductase delta subunit